MWRWPRPSAGCEARNLTKGEPLRDSVAAISCGIYRGTPVLDLDYLEDVEAHTDANFVMTGAGKFVEIQGTAEAGAVQPRRTRRR